MPNTPNFSRRGSILSRLGPLVPLLVQRVQASASWPTPRREIFSSKKLGECSDVHSPSCGTPFPRATTGFRAAQIPKQGTNRRWTQANSFCWPKWMDAKLPQFSANAGNSFAVALHRVGPAAASAGSFIPRLNLTWVLASCRPKNCMRFATVCRGDLQTI